MNRAAVVAIVVLGACQSPKGASSDRLVVARPTDAVSLDPARTSDIESLEVAEQVYGRLVRFSPAGWRSVENELRETSMPFDMTALLALLLVRGIAIADVPIHGNWCEVDSASDLKLYRRRLREAAWSHDWRPDAEAA
jgi:hypothetical protein